MRINPEAFKAYLRKVVPRKPLSAIAKETGIELERLEKALEEEVDFSYKELRRLGKALGITSWMLVVEPEKTDFPLEADRFSFRQLARTRKEGKIVWFNVLPESKVSGVVHTPHAGFHYLKDPLSPVLQCTGFADRRGVPVYEEDVVEVEGVGVGLVVWEEGSFCVTFCEGDFSVLPAGRMVDVYDILFVKGWRMKVLGNCYIASPSVYSALIRGFENIKIEVDESTFLRSVIYTGRKRPDGDDIVLYLERDWDTGKTYLTDLGETDMFIATHKDLEGSKEFKVEVNEENVLEKMEKLLKEIEGRFEGELGEFRFGG